MNDISYIFKKMWQKMLYHQEYLSIFWADNVVDSWVVDNRGITRGYDDYFYMFPWKISGVRHFQTQIQENPDYPPTFAPRQI